MKILGMLIALALVLFLVYRLAGDMGMIESGGEATMEPMKFSSEVADTARKAQDDLKKKIEELK